MKKAFVSVVSALLAVSLVGCGSSSTGTTDSGTTSGSDTTSSTDDKTITVGASPTPHAEILNDAVAGVLEKDGWTLKVVEFTDYVMPNTALEEGSLDANYFQTLGYMKDQNESNGLHLAAVAGVHIEPMGIYSSKITSLDDLQDGAEIALPNDADNLDRALRVLIQKGLLKDPGTTDYVDETTFNGNADLNPRGFVITPVEAAQVPRSLDDVDIAVVNGNYALEAGLPSTHPAIAIEDFDDEAKIRRTNFLVVKEDNVDSEKTKALVKAIQSDEVKQYIEDTYKGSVITSFITADEIK